MSNSKRYAYELCEKYRDSYPLPTQYMEWENSSFYQATNQSSQVIS